MLEYKTYPADNGKSIVNSISSLCNPPRNESSNKSQGRKRKCYSGRSNDVGGVIPHDASSGFVARTWNFSMSPRSMTCRIQSNGSGTQTKTEERTGEVVLKRMGRNGRIMTRPYLGGIHQDRPLNHFFHLPQTRETCRKNGPWSKLEPTVRLGLGNGWWHYYLPWRL